MANDISRRPWVLDTASTTVPVKAGRTMTSGFVFQNYTGGASSLAVLKDIRGKIIATLSGIAAGTPVGEAWFIPQFVEDLYLTQIDSGQVKVIVQ